MKLESINEQIENLDLDKSVKNSILALIDLKIASDMSNFESRLDAFEDKLENRLNASQKAIEFKLNAVLWVISIFGLMMAVFKFIG